MGNGVSGKASANLKTIYLDVEGRKHKVTREVSIFVVLVLVVLVVFSFRVAKYCNSENLIAVKLTLLFFFVNHGDVSLCELTACKCSDESCV